MEILAVHSAKGGVGKTTTAVNLAAAIAEGGRRVLLVDVDAQGSASIALGVRTDGHALAEALVGSDLLPIIPTKTSGVDLVPSGRAVGGAEKALTRELGGEGVLRDKLAKVVGYDIVILDPPPALGLLAVAALVAANRVVVPGSPHPLALFGVADMLQALTTIRERLNSRLELAGILLTMVDRRTGLAREVEDDLRQRFGERVLRTVIRQTVKIAEASGHGISVLAYAPDSLGAIDYRDLSKELSERIWRTENVAQSA